MLDELRNPICNMFLAFLLTATMSCRSGPEMPVHEGHLRYDCQNSHPLAAEIKSPGPNQAVGAASTRRHSSTAVGLAAFRARANLAMKQARLSGLVTRIHRENRLSSGQTSAVKRTTSVMISSTTTVLSKPYYDHCTATVFVVVTAFPTSPAELIQLPSRGP